MDESGIKGDLDGNVDEVNLCHGEAVDEHGTDSVEEELEGAEECFAEYRVEEEGFNCGREIGVQSINAKRLVVGEVVRLTQQSVTRRAETSTKIDSL